VSGNHGANDFWVVKLSNDAEITDEHDDALSEMVFPNPFMLKLRFVLAAI